MGAFTVPFEVGALEEDNWLALEGLVDTGSTYTWVPRDMLQGIGITPRTSREFETADGRRVERDIAVAMMRLEGETLPTLVVFADPGDSVLLGVYSLEGFGLGVDPVQMRLIPVPGLAMGRSALP